MVTRDIGTLRGIFTPGREAGRIIAGLDSAGVGMVATQAEAATGALSKVIQFRSTAKLMKGVSVGMNIALIGGLLAEGAYRGMTKSTEAMMKWSQFNGFRNLEFGMGVNPFPQAGSMTERQRALTAISNSRLNARSAMGGEAALAHEYTQ